MKRPPPAKHTDDLPGRLLWLAFAGVVAAFFVANFIVQRSTGTVGDLAERITTNAAPSIEHLTGIRRAVLETELNLVRYVHQPGDRRQLGEAVDAKLKTVEVSTSAYLNLASLEGEQEIASELRDAWTEFRNAVVETRHTADMNSDAANELLRTRVDPARSRLLEQATHAIELNAARNRELAAEIQSARRRTNAMADGLYVLCGLLSVGMAALLHRELRARHALSEAHTHSVEARAAELEQFAGRVAHDIRNPLSAALTSAQLALRRGVEDPARASFDRVVQSLGRANAITSALLEYARSGAKPEPGATMDPREVLPELISEAQPQASGEDISLVLEEPPRVLMACSTGVYLSLVGNLVRNAIKYMGESRERRITVAVVEEGGFVRTEVRDTGPGIPRDQQASLFEPFVRAAGANTEGIGLGLATVKKLAESHGGAVGVESAPGMGSTFWFVLPRAGTPPDFESKRWRGHDEMRPTPMH